MTRVVPGSVVYGVRGQKKEVDGVRNLGSLDRSIKTRRRKILSESIDGNKQT